MLRTIENPQTFQIRKLGNQIFYNLSLIVIFTFVMFPIIWIALSAFKLPKDVKSPNLFFEPTLQNFEILFSEQFEFSRLILNSTIVCVLVVLITLPFATMAAYALSRYRIPGKKALLIGMLATQFLPPVVLILPYFSIFRDLRLIDTYTALVILNLTRTLPFSIWLLKGFMDGLPYEIEQAAMVDGSTEIGLVRHIVLPLAAPGIVTSGIFAFLLAWNELLYAIILTSTNTRTVIVGLLNVVGERDVPWEQMSAAGIIVMVPMLILSFAIRRYFVEGMTMGAVK